VLFEVVQATLEGRADIVTVTIETTPSATGEPAMKTPPVGGRGQSTSKERSRLSPREARLRPGLEPLEARRVPATFAVNTLLDTVAVNLQDGMDAAGHASLLSAIMAANARPGADTILVPNGTIRLTVAGADEDAARGDLDIRGDLAIQGRGHVGTTIDGNALESPPPRVPHDRRPARRRSSRAAIGAGSGRRVRRPMAPADRSPR
jgi:hypothetical protein